jgi:rubrerythrin
LFPCKITADKRQAFKGKTVNVTLNVLEVLDIAGQIEQNGARYYQRAAEIFVETDVSKIFSELADWELRHKQIFAGMRKQYSELNPDTKVSESDNGLPEAKVMAGLAVFGIRSNPYDELGGKETISVVIKRAIENEKDSIVFYSGLKDFACDKSAKSKIDEIITEELRHIRILNKLSERVASVRS